MKILKYFPIALGLLAASCEDSADPQLLKDKIPATLDKSLEGTSYVFEEAKANEVAATFKWAPANFGYQAAVKYTVEASLPDAKFEKPVAIAQTTSTSINLLTGLFNEKVFTGLKIKEGVQTEILVRVKASISSAVANIYSEPIKIKVTPYFIERKIGKMWAPGNQNGWSFKDVVYSMDNNGEYENYFYYPANGEFLFTPADSWDNKFGGANGTLKEGGENILVKNDKAGMFHVEVSLTNMTYTLTPTDWSIIGGAVGGWEPANDVMFTWDANLKALVAEANFTTGEEYKFRANHDWKLDFGAGDEEGKLKFKAGNMRFTQPSGKYKVTFFIMAAEKYYTLEKL